MAMRRSGTGSGGGKGSKNIVHPSYKSGRAAAGIRHQAVAKIGSNMKNKVTERGRTAKSAVEDVRGKAPISVPLGNELAKNVGAGGPGAGRVLYGHCGTQSTYGSPAQGKPTPARDILRDFGPDVAGRK